jgi:Pyocin activator protein PrtN
MKTLFLLMGQYESRAVIPLETVRADYFSHLSMDQFLRKLGSGEIKLPVVRAEASQKAARGVHLEDLAEYLENRRNVAQRELKAMTQ